MNMPNFLDYLVPTVLIRGHILLKRNRVKYKIVAKVACLPKRAVAIVLWHVGDFSEGGPVGGASLLIFFKKNS